MTKRVPFGWNAADGIPQLPGLAVAGSHGPPGLEAWCRNPEAAAPTPAAPALGWPEPTCTMIHLSRGGAAAEEGVRAVLHAP